MARKTAEIPVRLERIEARLQHLETLLSQRTHVIVPAAPTSTENLTSLPQESKEQRLALLETAVEPWRFLVRRRHPWRKQLYIKGRNMTAWQLVLSMRAEGFDEAAAAADYHLPCEAVREAVAYVDNNKELLQTELEIEQLMLKRGAGGVARGPQPVFEGRIHNLNLWRS